MARNNAHEVIPRLQGLGIDYDDAHELRRISMTLHRWHELECGDSNDYASWTVTRGRKEGGEFIYNDDGRPFLERHSHSENKARYSAIPDREGGAKKRLKKIMARYPTLGAYIQGDPRGASLYICSAEDVRLDRYTNGVAVYR